jgi:hypothetical protein
MKLGALIREIYDNAGPIYSEIKSPDGRGYMIQISKSDFTKTLRRMLNGDTKAETGFLIRGMAGQRYLDLEPVIAPDAFEDVSVEELAREAMDDDRISGETERTRLIVEAAARRKKGIAEATAFIDRNVPRPAYMAAKFGQDQAAA